VLAADAAAHAAGLRIGMPASKAQALVPGWSFMMPSPMPTKWRSSGLALWALRRYAPIVAADPPDGLVIDTTGADHLHGGEAAMLTEMVQIGLPRPASGAGGGRRHLGRSPCTGPLRWRQTLVFHPGETAAGDPAFADRCPSPARRDDR
jgi:protein ImuB